MAEQGLHRAYLAAIPKRLVPEKTALARSTGHWVQDAWRIAAFPLVLLFLIPILMLFARTSPQAVLANIGQAAMLQAIGVSLRTTLTSLGLILLLGTPLAYLMGRYQFRYKKVLDTLIDLPTVLPSFRGWPGAPYGPGS